MPPELLRVAIEGGGALRGVGSGFGIEVAGQGSFRINGESSPAGQPHEHVWAPAARVLDLFVEVALGGHAGEFGHTAEREFAPTASRIRAAEGLSQGDGVFAEGRELGVDASHGVLALGLEFADLAFDAGERVGEGLGRVGDGGSGGVLGLGGLAGAGAEYYDCGGGRGPYYENDGG
jgi:hypothetical protein